MDFNGTFNNQAGSNEEKSNAQSMNNSTPKANDGFPKRWSFKEVMKQDEVMPNVAPSSSVPVGETTGDPEFDREWAEMMAKEQSEPESKFIAENQIAPV